MSFKQSKRDLDFSPGNFNPGPGHYELVHYPESVDRIEAQFIQRKPVNPQTSHSNWGHAERFRSSSLTKNAKDLPGPGEYLGISQWHKPIKKNPVKASFENQTRKILTIPSIPSRGQNYGYQETPDGMLMMISDPKSSNPGSLGPGSYDVKVDAVHKKIVAGVSFGKSKAERIANPPSSSHFNNPDLGPGAYDLVKPRTAEESQEKREEKQKRRQIRKEHLFPTAHKKQPIANKEDKLEMPGPGQYQTEAILSSFHPKVKHPNFQFFDSKEPRFTTHFKPNETPGPGDYAADVNDRQFSSKAPMAAFLGVERFQEQRNDSANPGPGSYETKSGFETASISENMIKEMIIEKPPAFGTSTRRFAQPVENSTETPGPGYYNPNKTKKRNKKRVIKYINPAILSPMENNYNGVPLSARGQNRTVSEFERVLIDNPKGHRITEDFQSRRRDKAGSSSFASKSKRFDELANRTTAFVGPGSHNVRNENFKVFTFNREKDILSKSRRDDNLSKKPSELPGPGYYTPNVDAVKPNRLALKIYTDPRQEDKHSLFL